MKAGSSEKGTAPCLYQVVPCYNEEQGLPGSMEFLFEKRGAWFGGSCPKGNRVGARGGVGGGRFGLGGRTGESKEGQVG